MDIKFENVSFCYESRKEDDSVRNLNFTIQEGEFILICGPSGSGKSTIGRLINGLAPGFYGGELKGSIVLGERDIRTIDQVELAGEIGSVFQNPRTQFFDTNSTGELAFGCENMGYPVSEIKERIYDATHLFGLESLLDRDIFQLSGGEKQKVACGSIYAVNPQVYVFDEPSSNLDFVSIEDLGTILKKLKAQKKTIILIEHRLHYAYELADWIFYMNKGCVEKVLCKKEFEALDIDTLHQMGLRWKVREADSQSFLCGENNQLEKSTSAYAEEIEPAVIVEKLDFTYKKRKGGSTDEYALKIRNLCIPKGKVIAVIGENGAGKSTFLRCMCGLEKKEKACIKRNDNTILSRKQRLKDSYLVMQDVNHQLFAESVKEELLLSDNVITEKQIYEYLSDLELDSFLEDHPMALSGGQKQRVAVAAACAAKKKYLYLDEPTSGLDFVQMKNMSKAIRKIIDKVEFVLIVTHDEEFILECCDYVIHLHEGTVKCCYGLENGEERLLCPAIIHD